MDWSILFVHLSLTVFYLGYPSLVLEALDIAYKLISFVQALFAGFMVEMAFPEGYSDLAVWTCRFATTGEPYIYGCFDTFS